MILFSFVDSYIKLLKSCNNDKLKIKEFCILFGLAFIIYIVLNQINQNDHEFDFKIYNKILLIILLIDLIISLTYIFRFAISNNLLNI